MNQVAGSYCTVAALIVIVMCNEAAFGANHPLNSVGSHVKFVNGSVGIGRRCGAQFAQSVWAAELLVWPLRFLILERCLVRAIFEGLAGSTRSDYRIPTLEYKDSGIKENV